MRGWKDNVLPLSIDLKAEEFSKENENNLWISRLVIDSLLQGQSEPLQQPYAACLHNKPLETYPVISASNLVYFFYLRNNLPFGKNI